MKKFLSLVLALVMTMSLVTVSAGAKDFTDNSKINYDEAVAVMSTLGVVGGYADGSFNPSATLTRGAAAKIICNVILGTTTANALVAKTAPYKDVPANHTFAGYIAYCQKEGIISGYADGTFKPANTLTGYAFMKMLLGALGLDAEVEGYTGPNWSISVAKRALSDTVDLADGLKGDFNGVKAVTREEACLYAFNMIQAKKFSYDNSSTIVVGNITVKNNSKATQDGNNVYYKDVFTKLKADVNAHDAFKRPATTWKYDGKEIGTYAKTADATYTAKVKQKDLWSDLDMVKISGSNTQAFNYYEDGDSQGTYTVDKDSSTKLGGKGVLLEVYYDTDVNAAGNTIVTENTIVAINTYIDEITDVDKNDAKERIVKIDNLEYVTSQFEEDDKVLYTKDVTGGDDDSIQSMVLAEKKTGTLTKISGDDYTIAGTTYSKGANATIKTGVDVKDDVDFYLDAYGYIIYMEESEDETSVDNLAYVEKVDEARGDYAILRLADGSKKTVDLDKSTYASLEKHVVSFKENKDGYKLTDKGAPQGVKTVDFEKGKPTVSVTSGTNYKTDSKTVFVYATETYEADGTTVKDTEYKSYTGYKAAPSIDGQVKQIVAYVKDNVAVFVYVQMAKASIGTTAADMTFVAYDDGADWTDEGDDVAYYELNAVVDGKITTVKVDRNTYAAIGNATGIADELVLADNGFTYNSDDIATAIAGSADDTVVKFAADAKTKSVKNDMIQVDGKALAYTDDVKVFFVDECKITAGTISSIRDDDNSSKNPYKQVVYHEDSTDVIDMIILVKN